MCKPLDEQRQYLEKEYMSLWNDHGVEDFRKRRDTRKSKSVPQPVVIQSLRSFRSLEDILLELGDCKRCRLCKGRQKIVFGVGKATAQILFVGEGPGADEDARGEPFVGRAGQLLTKIIEAMGLKRDEVYIANVVKCRPPSNRTPMPDEVGECAPFLKAQIEVIRPKIIVALGLSAASFLTGTQTPISRMRGHFHKLFWDDKSCVMPTFHPAYLLRNPAAKKMVWEDMKQVLACLGES